MVQPVHGDDKGAKAIPSKMNAAFLPMSEIQHLQGSKNTYPWEGAPRNYPLR